MRERMSLPSVPWCTKCSRVAGHSAATRRPPPWPRLSRANPNRSERCVPTSRPSSRESRRCLEKDPDRRWQSAADLADELEYARNALRGDDDRPSESAEHASRPSPWTTRVAAGVGLLLLLGSA